MTHLLFSNFLLILVLPGVLPLPQLSPALPSRHRQKSGCLRCQEADSSPNRLAATLGSPATGLRSQHLCIRWKDLEKLDPTAQESTPYDVGRTATRRPKFRRHYPRFSQLPDSDHDTSTAVGKISRSLTQPHKIHPHRSLDAPPRAAQIEISLWLKVKFLNPFTSFLMGITTLFGLKIITWLRNISTPSVSMEFRGYDTAKDVWDMLASRYAGSDGAREHHLMLLSEPVIKSVSDAKLVSTHRERTRFHQFLMGVLDDFESVRSQLLNRSPLPTVNQAVNDLVREETRLKSHRSSQPHTTVLTTPVSVDPTVTAPLKGHDKRRSNKKNSHLICAFCKHRGHTIDQCNMRARILQRSAALTASESVPSSDAAPFDPVSLTTPTYSIADLQALFNQVQVSSSSASNPALSVTPVPTLLLSYLLLPLLMAPAMTVSHVGSISTPNLSVSDVFCVPKLHLNLLSVGQLTELGLNLFFSSRGCLVQDSRTGQIVGTARKVGQLFELTSLHFPSSSVSAPVIAASASIELRHSRLGHDSRTGQIVGTARKVGRLFELTSLHFPSSSVSAPVIAASASIELWHSRLGTSQQNGRAERKHRHILDSVRAFLISASCPERSFGGKPLSLLSTPSTVFHPQLSKMVIVVGTLSLNVFAFLVMLFSGNIPCLIPCTFQLVLQSPALCPCCDPVTDQPPLLPLRRSDRVRAPPAHLRDYSCFSAVLSLHEPHTYREACTNPLWQQAMTEELQALEKTHTWDSWLICLMVNLPLAANGSTRSRHKSDGSIERYKARLVAKGYAQEYGIDYEETFAPVAPPSSFSNLQAIQTPDKVCLLRRALYGLKQAPRAWFAKFSSIVHQFGFSSSSHDTALFIRRSDKGMILLLLYVDDMIITGDDHSGISDFKRFLLHQQFEMKDLGPLSYFLGLEVSSSSDGYCYPNINLRGGVI
uniref:Reverse transcriptase Ty1/copia-type domain-containing protein n=1 Tax=Fagus sylvatica TaxID=28930 RepID=A0A2N9J1Q7_FAGSY